jgi:hypothetical protein
MDVLAGRRSVALRAVSRAVRRRHQPRGLRAAPGRPATDPNGHRPTYGIELDSEWRDRAGLNGGDFGSKRTHASKARAAADP